VADERYHFEQDRKKFADDLAYFLRNPKLSQEDRKATLEKFRNLLAQLDGELRTKTE
jgi:hypothetical protein